MPKNWKGDPLGYLNTQSVVKYQRNWRGTLWREKNLEKKSHNAEKLKKGTLWGFSTSILSQNIKKMKLGKIFIFEKNLTVPKKNWKGDPLGFSNIHSVAKQQKNWRGPLGKIFFPKKKSQCRKKLKGGPFGLARYGMLRGKTGKTFLVQFARPNSQFGAIIFCRTSKNYFGQFVWIEKKRNATIIVAFHFMKRRLKKEKPL